MTRKKARLGAICVLTFAVVIGGSGQAVAHGLGGRADLPVPVSFFIIGAGIAVAASFLALAALWPEARLQERVNADVRKSRQLGRVGSVLAAAGMAGLALVVLAGIANRQGDRTISPVLVWVYFWLVVPFVAAGIGNWWRAISPWRKLAVVVNRGVPERLETAGRLGMWPATIAFIAFTWLELVSTTSDSAQTLALAAVVYSLYVLAATRYLGVESGLSSAGAFENYNAIVGAVSPFRWAEASHVEGGDERRLTVTYRGWLRGLPSLGSKPGFIVFVVAMIGTVTYDGLSGSSWWSDTFPTLRHDTWFATVALLGAIAVIGAGYWLASAVAASMTSQTRRPIEVARSFAHTLVPIALAYAVVHYLTLVLVEGQLLLHTASDPFGLGWNIFGTAGWRISWVPAPEVIWYLQVATIVAGHIAGVVLAHDRALHEFGGRHAVRTQYAMLVLMVALTSLGLWILSG